MNKHMDEEMHRTLRKEGIMSRSHLADHAALHHDVNKLEHEVSSLKEHELPHWKSR
jgi:hypothetical protein